MGRPITPMNQKLLIELLEYDKETGLFKWKCNRKGHTKAMDFAGSRARNGYIDIMVCGKRYGAHRLAWMYVYGDWPAEQIDHINGIRDDNRFENLRDVPSAINKQNIRNSHKDSKTGILGVRKNGRGFEAHIQTNGVFKSLGTFRDLESARNAYIQGKRLLHIGCTL